MLEIRPIDDEHEKRAVTAHCRMRYLQNTLAYGVFRDGAPLAVTLFRCEERCAVILTVGHADNAPESTEQDCLLGALAFCAENGCDRVTMGDGISPSLAHSLGLACTAKKATYTW